MKININGKDIEVKEIRIKDGKLEVETVTDSVKLATLKPGTVFNDKYIVLEHLSDTETAVIRKDLLDKKMSYGSTNNFNGSDPDKYLNGIYLTELEAEFGVINVLKHTVDLLSMDGLDDYGKIERKVSLLTIDQYRKYRKLLGENMPNWWWLATPDSTQSGWSSIYVRDVGSGGVVSYDNCGYSKSLRPYFVLNSSIYVTEQE